MTMKTMILVAGLAALLAGCESPERNAETACINRIESESLSPASVKVVDITSHRSPYGNPTQITVDVTYDAANSFGVPLRSFRVCEFPFHEGRAVTAGPEWKGAIGQAVDEELRKSDEAIANAIAAQMN